VTGSSNPTGRLSPLQRDLLEAFFERTDRFFLTGGGALVEFHLKHRDTKDLDLFGTAEVDLDEGVRALRAAVAAVGASERLIRDSVDFRQFRIQRGAEATLVDLVRDRAPQVVAQKQVIGRIRVDPVREIAANKVCAVLGRGVVRDLVDLKALLERGLRLEEVIADANLKDGGANPAALAWVLSDMHISPDAAVPAGVSVADLDRFREELIGRLAALAVPRQSE
jgi:hypothetical protein